MSEAAQEAMDSSAVSEEEMEDQQEAPEEDKSSPNKSINKISSVGEIIEGKRAKKTVERLDFQAPKQKTLTIGDGSGDKLGDIPRIGYQINKIKPADLKLLHSILFDRPGKLATIKKNLRQFNGFPFDADSEQFTKKREKLLKSSNFTNSKLKVVCGVLDLEKKGTHSDLVDRIVSFLVAPKDSGKRLPVKKKRKSKKKLSGDDSKSSAKKKSKPKPRSSSSSPKKSKTGSKSKAIVMDSSSDDDEEEDEEKAGASAEAEGSDTEGKASEKEEEQSEKSEESEDEGEEEEEEDDDDDDDYGGSSKSKSGKGKSSSKKAAPGKRQRTPAKKAGPPKKRAKKETTDESEADSDAEEKPKKKKPAPAKPAAKTKKADSSSNSKNNTNTAEDSSDDDEPLIKMIKKAPTDDQLKETVQSLLKEANLEEMTMKQICQRVYDTYPDHDLTSRKDYIKQTVKSLIT